MVIILHLHRADHRLHLLGGDARDDKIALFKRFRALCGDAYADHGKRQTNAVKEGTFLRQSAGIRNHTKGAELQMVVIRKTKGLQLSHIGWKTKPRFWIILRLRGWVE